jgi:hypothetical protein
MLNDRGDERNKAESPNLLEFWQSSDPKVRVLREDVKNFREELLYGDPFMFIGRFGKGKVVAVTTTAGREWNDWGGGSMASEATYAPIILEMQSYMTSFGGEGNLTVGTPQRVEVDTSRFKDKAEGKALKLVRFYHAAQRDKPLETRRVGDQFGEPGKDKVTFPLDKNFEPGFYSSYLLLDDGSIPAGQDAAGEKLVAGKALASWGHTFNVDTGREGDLMRVSREDLDSNLRGANPGYLTTTTATSTDIIEANRQNDLSESPWFYLFFIAVLVAEQALAVHLSFHIQEGEAQIPSRTVRTGPAAAA